MYLFKSLFAPVLLKVVNSVLFRPKWPERSVPFKKPAQNDVVFVSVSIPVRSGNSGQIPAGTFRFRSGRSVPALKSFFFFLNLLFFFFLILRLCVFDFVFILYNLKLNYLEF